MGDPRSDLQRDRTDRLGQYPLQKVSRQLASDDSKPDDQFAVAPEMGAAWVATLPVSHIHGIGPVAAATMARLGITTGADLSAKSMDFLADHFGESAG